MRWNMYLVSLPLSNFLSLEVLNKLFLQLIELCYLLQLTSEDFLFVLFAVIVESVLVLNCFG